LFFNEKVIRANKDKNWMRQRAQEQGKEDEEEGGGGGGE
jgi:hypothetical protein